MISYSMIYSIIFCTIELSWRALRHRRVLDLCSDDAPEASCEPSLS